MKKILIFSAIFTVVGLSACKKQYTCPTYAKQTSTLVKKAEVKP